MHLYQVRIPKAWNFPIYTYIVGGLREEIKKTEVLTMEGDVFAGAERRQRTQVGGDDAGRLGAGACCRGR